MNRYAIIPLLLVSWGAAAQAPAGKAASAAEGRVVNAIVDCMATGLPDDWREAVMVVELAKPGDQTGKVQYLVARGTATQPTEPFTPCDMRKPAMTLLDARLELPAERQGWTGARVSVQRDGKFGLKYDYPKK